MINATLRGKPDAGNPHVRFDEGEVASAQPRRGSLLYKTIKLFFAAVAAVFFGSVGWADDGKGGTLTITGVSPTYIQYMDLTVGGDPVIGENYRAEPGEKVVITISMSAEASCNWQTEKGESTVSSVSDGRGGYVTTYEYTHEAGKSSFVGCEINSRYSYGWYFVDKPTAENPAATLTSATPANGSRLTLADGDKYTLSVDVTVEPTGVELSYKWIDGSTWQAFADADSTKDSYEYTYAASAYDKQIYCQVFKKGAEDKDPLCSAYWTVAGVTTITPSREVTDVYRNRSFDLITFTVPGKSTSSWSMDKLGARREANSFADILAKSTVAAGATKLTLDAYGQGSQTISGYFQFANCAFQNVTVSGCGLNMTASSYYCYVNQGLSGSLSYDKDGEGVFYIQDGTDAIFRWKGTLTSYSSGGGDGGSTGAGSTGSGSTGSGTGSGRTGSGGTGSGTRSSGAVTYDVNFAIVLSQNGTVRYVYGDCGGATCSYQSVSGRGPSGTMSGSSSTPGEVMSQTSQDVVIKKALPSGLTFTSKSTYGQLSGTPSENGTFTFKVSCYVTGTGTISREFTFTVADPPPPVMEIVPPLSNGKVGTAYSASNFRFKDLAVNSDYYWQSAPMFASVRSGRTFVASGGDKLSISSTYLTKSLSFAFPICGSQIPSVNVYKNQMRFMYNSSGTSGSGSSTSFAVGLFSGTFSTTASDDGIFYSSDGSTYETIRWKGTISTYVYDKTTGTSTPVSKNVNASVTLKANGEIVIAFGDCGGMAMPSVNVSASGPSGNGGYYFSSAEAEYIDNSTPDIVLKSALPPGLSFSTASGDLSGTPTEAGTYNFTITGCLYADGSTYSTNCTVVIAAADPVDPPVVEKKLEILTKTLAGGKVGEAYEDKVEVESSSELDKAELSGGALPDGLTLVAAGMEAMLFGTPTKAGKFTFEVTLANKDGLEVSEVYEVEIESSGSGGGGSGGGDDPPAGGDPELKDWSPSEDVCNAARGTSPSFSVTMEPDSGLTYVWTFIEKKEDEPSDPEANYLLEDADKATCKFKAEWNGTFELYCYVNGTKVRTWTINVGDAPPENHIWYVNQNSGNDSNDGLSVATARQNVYAVNAIYGDEVRILYHNGLFNYAASGVRYVATNGVLVASIGTYGAWLQNVELAADGSGNVIVNVSSIDVASQTGPAIKIARVSADAKLSDYDTASGGGGTGGADTTSGGTTASGGSTSAGGGSASGGSAPEGRFQINWGSGIAWDGAAYLMTNAQDEVWIMRNVGYPAPVCGGQGPTVAEASQANPKQLIEGSSENFYVIVTNVISGLHVYYRWEIDGVAKPDYSMAHLNYAPTHDKVDGNVHRLVCYSSNEYHTDAVTNEWFFMVTEAPLSCGTTMIRDEEGAFEYDLDADVIGGKGARTYAPTNEVPEGVSVSAAGVISGEMNEAVRGKKVSVVVTDEENTSIIVEITLQPQFAGEEDFYLVGCTPDVEELEVYLGERPKFEIVGRSDSVAAIDQNYLWFWNGSLKSSDPESFTPGEMEIDPNLEGETLTLSVYGTATYGTAPHGTLIKQWRCTIRDREFGFKTTSLPALTVGQSMAQVKAQVEFYVPYQQTLTNLELLRGQLPPGMHAYGTQIAGSPRMSGNYSFVLRATCSNGDVAVQEFVMTVNAGKTGDVPAHAWHIDATGAKHGENDDWCVTTVNAAITQGLMNGDEVYVYSGMYDNLDFFTKLKNVPVHIVSGTVTARVNAAASLDVSGFIVESGVALAFAKGEYINLNGEDQRTWGYPVRLAKVPSGKTASDFAVTGFTHPEYVQTPKIDAEGWLYLEKGLWQDTEQNGFVWHLDLADKVGRRDAVIRDYAFTTALQISSTGVIPGTVTFDGNVTVGEVSLRDAGGGAVKAVVAATGALTLTTADVDFAGTTLELKSGATINTPGYGFYNRGLVLPAVGVGKVNLNLTQSLGQYSEMMLFRQYSGDSDAAKQFTLTKLPADAETYRYVFWYGELKLVTYPESGDGAPGTLVWDAEADPANLGSFSQFADIKHTFGVTGGGKYLGYAIPDAPFVASRGESSTFSSRGGSRELMYRPLRRFGTGWNDFDDTVDIGFAFPFCGKYYASVRVGAEGLLYFGASSQYGLRILGNTRLSTLEGSDPTYCDVYISRGENKFTVRYGEFGSITLTPDGVIRMAFGADASLNSGREPTSCSYFVDGNTERYRYSLPNVDFANQPDLLFTPSGVPLLSFDSKQDLVGTIDVPGDYEFSVKATEVGNGTLTRKFNLTVTAVGTQPEIMSVTAPEAAADGFIHLAEGASANFSVQASSGAVAKWTLEYDGKSVTTAASFVLTAPANRTIHRLARVILEVEGPEGTWSGTYRKSWWVAFNKSIACASDADIPADLESSMLPGDELVLADGTYHRFLDFGENPAAVTIRSASGDASKVVLDGGQTNRCFRQCMPTKVATANNSVYAIVPAMCRNATIRNVSLLNGRAEYTSVYKWRLGSDNYGVAGGAAFGGTFENCIIGRSTAVATGTVESYGGGVYGAKLTGCLIAQNTAMNGGGCSNCELYDCTVADNVASAAAGGVDGQCYAKDSIIRYNVRGNEENEYEPTYRPNRLVADVPTIVDSFTAGDPLFCNDYSLANGSLAAGKGAYPDPHAGDCLVRIEIVGGGTVMPYENGKVIVANGASQTFDFSGRTVTAVYLDDEKVADSVVSYTLANVTANRRLRVVFATETMKVGPTRNYKRITDALAAAADGDTIEVDEGTYQESVDVSGFVGELTIRAMGSAANTVIDGNGAGRCFLAVPEATNVKLVGFTLKNGYVTGSSGFGGGAYGGYLEDCVITNCVALGGKGGGAYKSRLVRCGLYGNRAGDRSISQSWFTGAWGGGAYGGYLNDCRVNANRICATNKPKSDGAGTYDAEVRNSFVWGNYADIDQTSYERSNNAKAGSEGVLVYTRERVPTQANLDARKVPIAVTEKVVYATHAAAVDAAPKQIVDIPSEVARKVSDLNAYADLFEIATVEEGGQYVNKPVLKEAVQEAVREQIVSVLTEDDSGNARTEFNVQKMEKTLTETTPGLYYALEFSSDLTSGSFRGERHLATGKGSVKLSATSLDTSSGFWRVNVYMTPDAD